MVDNKRHPGHLLSTWFYTAGANAYQPGIL